jgi:iron(III) transport system substrate-binding protein
MKKSVLCGMLAALLVCLSFEGCSGSSSTASQASAESGSEAVAASETSSGGSVTVYSPNPADALNTAVKEFQEKTGITVNVVGAGTGELLKRIKAESANPLGDVMYGGGADSLSAYSDYFESYISPETNAFDPGYIDPGGKWTGISPLPMVIIYNKNLVSEADAPQSWADLTDPKWKGKIAYADPTASGSAYTQLCTMLTAYGKDNGKGWEFIKKFVENLDGKLLSSSGDVPKKVNDGEYSVGLTLEKEAMLYLNANGSIGMTYPSDGTSTVPDAIAMIKNCKNKENAKKFIDFVAGKELQSLMLNQFNIRPVRSDVPLLPELKALKDIKVVDYDFTWASDNKSDILSQWKDILVG